MDTKAKCRHLKKFTCKGTLRQVFTCKRLRNPYPPPPPTHVYTCSILIHTGKGGELNTREKGRGATQESTDPKAGLKYQHDSMYWKYWLSTLINTCRNAPLQVNFFDDDILHCLPWVLSFYGSIAANLEICSSEHSLPFLGKKYCHGYIIM